MTRFSRGDEDERRAVRALLERPPSVKEKGWSDAVLALFEADPALEWVPVLGSGSRPLAVAGRPLGLNVEPRLGGVERVEPDLSLSDAVRRALARPASERLVPLLRCDSRDRYVAVVRVERIIDELADAYEAQPLPSPQS
ncbi:MAG TPA: hypothetical protein VEX39_08395 [Thermoleophilaceae bacterium]|nr:hypothetical protein [Thermoleophilaceae bacterium]